MLPTGGVFQLYAGHVIRVPPAPHRATVSVGMPGFVGAVAILNSAGLAMGVDVVRSALSDADAPGLNSMLLLRTVAENVHDLPSAIAFMEAAPRGCAWLYPMCDASGACAIVEAGANPGPGAGNPDVLSLVKEAKLRALLPSAEELVALRAGAAYASGMWVRAMDWIPDPAALAFNAQLLPAVGGMAYNASSFTDPQGYVFATFALENELIKKTGDSFFLPQRETFPDVVLTTNSALIPEFRVSTMAPFDTFLMHHDQTSPTWRYDRLNDLITQRYGSFDFETAWDTVMFLSPRNTPGFYPRPTPPSKDPMSAEVEGSTSLVDLAALRMRTLTGYYLDRYVETTLANYL